MLGLMFNLFMAFGLFMFSLVGFAWALSMYHKSKTICKECEKELEND
jgi:hypothetical protein